MYPITSDDDDDDDNDDEDEEFESEDNEGSSEDSNDKSLSSDDTPDLDYVMNIGLGDTPTKDTLVTNHHNSNFSSTNEDNASIGQCDLDEDEATNTDESTSLRIRTASRPKQVRI